MSKVRIIAKEVDGITLYYMVQRKVLFNLMWVTDGADDGTPPAGASGYSPFTFNSVTEAEKYIEQEYGKKSTRVVKTFEL